MWCLAAAAVAAAVSTVQTGSSMATLVGAVVALLLMVVVWAAEQTANLQLSQSGGSRWEGKACFHLESAIGGWEVVFEFAGQGVRSIEVKLVQQPSHSPFFSFIS